MSGIKLVMYVGNSVESSLSVLCLISSGLNIFCITDVLEFSLEVV